MGSFLMLNVTAISFGAYITNLNHPADEYDYFKFRLSQNGVLIFEYNHTSSSDVEGFSIVFTNENYLGYNYVTPNTDYSLTVIARYNGSDYSLGTEYFTTDSVSPPSGTITPSVYTKIKNQNYESCVAMSLSTAMDIFKAKQTGITYENYSVSYIFGNGGHSWGMNSEEAVLNCISDGSPRWELVSPSFPDDKSITESEYTYNNADNYAKSNAILQRFDGYNNIDFYDCSGVANAIQNYGYFMFNFRIPNNFYNIGSDGIVPQPNTYSGVNHSLALIGLTVKNGKPHWIAQNSWGAYWGLNGICYIPWDWGIGVLAPTRGGSSPTSWTTDCYSVWNNGISSANPIPPTNVTAVRTGDLTANVSWNTSLTGALYTVFAREKYSSDWYIKGRTTNTNLNIVFNSYREYEIRVLSTINNLYSDYSNVFTINMSAPKLPTPSLDTSATIKTINSIQVTANDMGTAYGTLTYWCFLYNSSGTLVKTYVDTQRTFLFSSLVSGETYTVKLQISTTGYTNSDWAVYYVTTLTGNFAWTTTERTALTSNGYITVLTYLRWNEFVNKVKSVIDSIGGTWVTDSTQGATLAYTQTLMTSTDKVVSANRFNSIRFNIGARMPTGINRVYINDDILGSYFITLETKLNEWIASI